MSPPKVEQPAFLIVAGPNGSGKSRAYQDTDIEAEGRSVWIVNPDLLTARIQETEGLALRHHVSEEDIRRRHARSLQQFPWFLEQADRAWIYDNSGAEPKRIGEKIDGLITLDEDALPVIVEAVRSIETP